MIEIIKKFLKEIQKMLTRNEVSKALKIDLAVNQDMLQAINTWAKIYENKADWLNEDVKSLGIGSQISNELAKMVILELKTEITGSKRADYINEQYQYVIDKLLSQIEYGNAKGGMIFKPYVDGNKIITDFIQADKFYPVSFNNADRITSAIFMSQITKGDYIYTRLELHSHSNNTYTIINKAYRSREKGTLGDNISLANIDEWAELQEEVVINNIKQPLFGYYKVPLANNIDSTSPLGVSCYSRAVDLIKDADKQYGRAMWEYEASEKAIFVDKMAMGTTDKDGRIKMNVAQGKKRLYQTLDSGDDGFFKDYSPAIRDEAFWNGLNNILRRIEYNCGLAYGTISDPNETSKTATEIKTSKKRSFDTVSNMQKSLQQALEDLIYAIDTLATLYELAPAGTYETTFNFDDSILTDSDKEREQDLKDVSAGLMNDWEYRMKWYGETEEVAKGNIPEKPGLI